MNFSMKNVQGVIRTMLNIAVVKALSFLVLRKKFKIIPPACSATLTGVFHQMCSYLLLLPICGSNGSRGCLGGDSRPRWGCRTSRSTGSGEEEAAAEEQAREEETKKVAAAGDSSGMIGQLPTENEVANSTLGEDYGTIKFSLG
jgi:hypothetical protein